MKLHVDLKSKLIILLLLSSTISLLLVGFLLTYFIQNLHNKTAQRDTYKTFSDINRELQLIESDLLNNFKIMSRRQDIISSLNMINEYQSIESYQPIIFDEEKKKLSSEFLDQAKAASIDVIAVYDGKGVLSTFLTSRGNSFLTGIISYEKSQPLIYITEMEDKKEWPISALPSLVKYKLTGKTPDKAEIIYRQIEEGLIIESNGPVIRYFPDRTYKTVGYIVMAKTIKRGFTDKISDRNNLDVAIVLDNGEVTGNLKDISTLERKEELCSHCENSETDIPNIDWIDHRDYFLHCHVIDRRGGEKLFFFTGVKKSVLYSEIKKTVSVILSVLLISAIISLPAGIITAEILISGPVRRLIEALKTVKSGQYGKTVNIISEDEIGLLTQTFNEMSLTIKQRNLELSQLKENLVNLVEERTSNLKNVNEMLALEIEEKKKIELLLKQKAKELERSNTELEQFAFIASHDMQEPLRNVSNYSELLQKRYKNRLDDKADKYIHYIIDGTTRMRKLIQDLLTYSRIHMNESDFKNVDTEIIIKMALSNISKALEDRKAEITYTSLPKIKANETQMIQLFQNLIENAIKYNNNENPKVEIKVRQNNKTLEKESEEKRRNNMLWEFSMTDNGIGIEEKHYDTIFEMFSRLHGKGEYSGTGIGLAVCKKIVEKHGGEIWVRSGQGEGSTFFFTIQSCL